MIIKRRVTKGFVQIPNEVVRDKRLSLDEHGMLHYLLSLPDDWEVNLKQLETYWGIGRDRRQRIFRALHKSGWARLERLESEDGVFLGRRWIIGDEPGPEQQDEDVVDDEDIGEAREGDTTPATAAPESQGPDALASVDREPPFPTVGSPDGRVSRPSEKAAVLQRKTLDEQREDTNTMAEGRSAKNADPASSHDDGAPPPGFGSLLRLWPADNVVSAFACEKAFAKFTDAQKRAAHDGIKPYLQDCRERGHSRLCDLRTYLDERRFEKYEGRPQGRQLYIVKRGTPEAERWREHLRKQHPNRLPGFDAALSNQGYTAESQWPPPADPQFQAMKT